MADNTDAGALFSASFAEARNRFLACARQSGAEIHTYTEPGHGPDGEMLACDTAWLGPADAPRVLVLLSGTHGVEGFCGSAAQCDWLAHHASLPPATAALAIHAINPYGFAWLRRVTQEGVDLNRNFVDFGQSLPDNPGYDELADAIVPERLDGETLAQADARLTAYREAHGQAAFERALSGGQYSHPHGLFYGGSAPCWSRRTSESIAAAHRLAGRQRVALLDFHTGLGPFGYGEPICDHPPASLGVRLSRTWYGDSVTEPALGTSSSVAKHGLSDYGWQQIVGEALVFIALEFGTYSMENMLSALRADHWLHARGEVDWQAQKTQQIKAAIRRQFYPATPDWQQMVLFRCRQVIAQALAGLEAEPL